MGVAMMREMEITEPGWRQNDQEAGAIGDEAVESR